MERQRNRTKKKLILVKMFIARLELTSPDSGGQCATHCAMKDLKSKRVFVLFIDNRYLL